MFGRFRLLVTCLTVLVALSAAGSAHADTWSPAASMDNARDQHTATFVPGGTVLVTGGIGSSNSPIASAERYDSATGRWSPAGSMGDTRREHTATLLAD